MVDPTAQPAAAAREGSKNSFTAKPASTVPMTRRSSAIHRGLAARNTDNLDALHTMAPLTASAMAICTPPSTRLWCATEP